MNRKLTQVLRAQPSTDGAGVAIQRVAGFEQRGMDPILMIDELRSEHREDFAAGFPPHPHRGMQTLTYMKHGGIIHEDSQGNRGEIRGGGAQYMSAGRGIIHSEMPTQDTLGLHGFQLWFNLPAAEKMQAPRYRDLPLGELTQGAGPGFTVTAISGEWNVSGMQSMVGPLQELAAQAALADFNLDAAAELTLETGSGESVMAYVYNGSVDADAVNHSRRQLLLFGEGEQLTLKGGSTGAGLLVLRGRPIGEKVVHYGPFVMNTEAEIEQAIRDYQSGQFAA
ncbi:pirin family protein [Congregibacter variabilis]|uniref:Pirin family protein n=1 Tax=Congregibacter variabilis TaxID=3081200 RepID=A0ABZ0I1Y1_9GAMM|nr:pirin family protein [Congregibacter sp. IMCC43200]